MKLPFLGTPGACCFCGRKLPPKKRKWCGECTLDYFRARGYTYRVDCILRVLKQYGKPHCERCGYETDRASYELGDLGWQVDHKVPIALGGSPSDQDNLWLLCPTCVCVKNPMDLSKIQRMKRITKGCKSEDIDFVCPFCSKSVKRSEYLHEVFQHDVYADYAANLVTHFRHDHIVYYNRSCNSFSYAKKSGFNGMGYDSFKAMVNNRAKRQLIRAAKKNFPWAKAKPLIAGFLRLEHNDRKTLMLIDRILKVNYFVKQTRLDGYEKC